MSLIIQEWDERWNRTDQLVDISDKVKNRAFPKYQIVDEYLKAHMATAISSIVLQYLNTPQEGLDRRIDLFYDSGRWSKEKIIFLNLSYEEKSYRVAMRNNPNAMFKWAPGVKEVVHILNPRHTVIDKRECTTTVYGDIKNIFDTSKWIVIHAKPKKLVDYQELLGFGIIEQLVFFDYSYKVQLLRPDPLPFLQRLKTLFSRRVRN